MAWFLNHYECYRCGSWSDEWSCTCDDDCPHCGARHASPTGSDDLTEIIVDEGDTFLLLRSSDSAEQTPRYQKIARFPTAELAAQYGAETRDS